MTGRRSANDKEQMTLRITSSLNWLGSTSRVQTGQECDCATGETKITVSALSRAPRLVRGKEAPTDVARGVMTGGLTVSAEPVGRYVTLRGS